MKHVILIPTYNEAENIETIISKIFSANPEMYIKVIDDNSPDGTAEIVKKLFSSFPNLSILERKRKEGLGKAYMHGFREVMQNADATHIIMMDADMSHDPVHLAEMIQKSKSHDLVVGSRYISGGKTVGWELWRRMLSYFGNLYARIITGVPVNDLTGGFNCISISRLKNIDLDVIDSSGYAFQIELKYMLHLDKASIVQIPITFANRTGGESKISNHIVSEGLLAPWKMIFREKKSKMVSGFSCPMCESKSIEFFTQKNSHNIYKCKTCKLLFLYPIPKTIDVYDESYFSGAEDGFGYVDYDEDKKPMISTFEKYLDYIKKCGVSSGKLLDVGAATGFFMNLAQKRGFNVIGVEISDFAASRGRKKGLNIVTGDLESAHFLNQAFNVVTLCDVIEHVPNPKKFLVEIKRTLASGGLLMLNTPNAESFIARLFGKHWHLIVPLEHLHYFSPKNLTDFLTQNGFEILQSTSIGKRFTLQYIFKTLYKWQKLKFWDWIAHIFSKGFLSRLYLPINLHDNFFMIARKK